MKLLHTKKETILKSTIILESIVLTTFLLIGIAWLLSTFFHPEINIDSLKAYFINDAIKDINPKPKEKFIFLFTLLLLPFFSFISLKLISSPIKLLRTKILPASIIIASSIAIFLLLRKSEFSLLLIKPVMYHRRILFLLYFITLLIFYCSYKKRFFESYKVSKLIKKIFFPVIVLLIIITPSITFRMANLHLVDQDNGIWNIDFESVFYTLSQVVAGKTLLVNLPAQYGMYSELLNPLFKLIGLSVFNFTLIMQILQISALTAIFITALYTIKNRVFVLACMFCICMVSGTWFTANGMGYTPYYQYFPLRLFFPMVSCFAFIFLVKSKNLSYSHLIFLTLLSALAVIWNVDTGVPILGAFLAYIISYILFPTSLVNRKIAGTRLIVVISLFSACLILFFTYLYIKSGYIPLDLYWLTKYQKIFYQSGFMMLPIPTTFHAWQLIYVIYLSAMTIAIFHWINNNRTTSSDMLFFLSILGYGLFVYYEGRSHIYNLLTISWPAFLVTFIICDHIMRLMRAKMIAKFFGFYCLIAILFATLIAGDYIYRMSYLIKYAKIHWKTMLSNNDTKEIRNLQFIKHYLGKEKNIVIISPIQSIYYAELNIPSAIDGPGIAETILKSDLYYYQSELAKEKSEMVFIQLDSDRIPFKQYQSYLSHYKIKAISSDRMACLVKK